MLIDYFPPEEEERAAYVWARYWPADGAERFLTPFVVGDPPSWWEYLESYGGLNEILTELPYGEDEALAWMLNNGVAPGQPFLVRVSDFRSWSSHTLDGYDYDEEWDWEVVAVEPWSPERVARAFASYSRRNNRRPTPAWAAMGTLCPPRRQRTLKVG